MAAWPPLQPTPEQQAVLYRIAAQRARFYERRELRAQYRAAVRAQQGLPPDASVAMRAGAFARQHPLALYIYSHDKAVQDFYLHHTLSGGVSINDSLIHTGLHNLPFGGVGHSGMGHYHGYEGFLTFSKLRPVFQQSRWRTVDLLMPPYGKRAYQLLKFMFWRNR